MTKSVLKRQSYLRNISGKFALVADPAITIDAGIAGSLVSFGISQHPIGNSKGTDIGGQGDTSISITAGTVFTTQVGFKADADLANGEYWVDHLTGEGRGRKADTSTTITFQVGVWSVQTSAVGSSSSSSSTSSSVGGGPGSYSNVQGDFTATANSGAKTITLSAYANTVLSSTISVLNFTNAVIKRKTSAGVVDTLPLTTIAFTTNVLTLSDMSANFAVGDTVSVFISGNDKGFDEANDAIKVYNIGRAGGEKITNDWQEVRDYNLYATMINTATETVINAGATLVGNVVINNTLVGTVEVFDGVNSAGTRKLNLAIGTTPNTFPIKAKFGTSLRIKNSSASDHVLVTWDNYQTEA